MLLSFNKQAPSAISPSYQPVTLYGEDKSRQLKLKLLCAVPRLPSFCVSPDLSLSPALGWSGSDCLCQEQKPGVILETASQTQKHLT